MRKQLASIFASLTLILVALIAPAAARSSAIASSMPRERHPMIQRAINALERAKDDLQDAAHDYCGHRVEALEATNNAINQLRLALRSDRARLEPLEIYPEGATLEKASFVSESFADEGFMRERHPKIREAIRALERAKSDLQHAAHDFNGHREEAVEAVNRALNQLNAALACDRD
ncbi:MAG TPA: hypothetical protein VKB86_15010 [Pyrinomonadaceae bacterium]|nr:hypothetical protein [Pyrinomonadaceae bacterium]